MRIGFGSTVLEKGLSQGHMDGIGVYANNLWQQFDTITKHAVSFGQHHPSVQASDLLGEITHLPLSYPIQSTLSILGNKPFLGSKKLEKEIDLFFAPDHHIPKLKHTPVVATIMDAYPLIHPELVSQKLRWFKNMAFKRASKWADHIITISEYSKQDIVRYFEILPEKISVVPLGVNKAYFQPVLEVNKERVRQKFGLKEDFFIFVGTIQPRKNLPRLIEAYESLPKEIRQKHALVIIGQYGWGEERLIEKLNATDHTSTIRRLEKVTDDELYALLQSALAMVYPSLYEGFGLPILEGFASKIPVITSSTTSIPEVAGDAAYYVNPLDSVDIAAKMLHLAQDQTLRQEMIQKGWQRVQSFSWEKSAQEHLKIFNKII